jgi:hypothetical protein
MDGWVINKQQQGSTALPPEMVCDQTAIDLPPVMSAVYFIAK